jgi:hypothetical protein
MKKTCFITVRIIVALVPLLLAACSTNVVVSGDYPSALTKPLPDHVGLVLNNSFTQYTFKSEEEQDVTMALGQSQSKLFDRVFTDIFANKSRLQTVTKQTATTPNPIDLMIVPSVEEVQLAMPFETRLNVFEVWIKYNVQVFNGDGEPIADWLMSAYGKTQTRFLKSEEAALNQATTSALRDAGVRLIVGFKHIPEIRDWIEHQQKEQQQKNKVMAQNGDPS